ncbi:MAG: RNHCP domain-containing protein [Phycisphaerales bacterium JB064]
MTRENRENFRRERRARFDDHSIEIDQPDHRTARPRHGRRDESDGFTCIHCKAGVSGSAWGTKQRNHCPACLHSKHVDDRPGDRASPCGGKLEPIAIAVRSAGEQAGEWVLVHRCLNCGELKTNRIAGDDSERALLALALRPLARPAFPIDDPRGA